MAVAQTSAAMAAKAKTASSNKKSATAKDNASAKAKSQMHRRSRTGCYTCRLRRKKCDEGNPLCTACKHLGLQCEYKRPMWWSNTDARRKHKEDIKMIIKRKKLSEKTAAVTHPLQTSGAGMNGMPSPPGLSHSLPTSATFTDPLDRTRSASIDSHFSAAFNFNSPPSVPGEYGVYNSQVHPDFLFSGACGGASAGVVPGSSPYEIDVKTERQMFVNDVPTLRESHVSTFSTYHTPPPPGTVLTSNDVFDDAHWARQHQHQHRQSRKDSVMSEESLNPGFFDFSSQQHTMSSVASSPAATTRQVEVELDENDQRLLEHFIQFVLPVIFPILESNQHGSISSDLILPALQSNRVYLHCCLSIAAQHLKSARAEGLPSDDVDQDIMRHRYATIWALCDSLKRDENHQQILEATLGLIFFQCVVGRPDDGLLDIPWHQHFQAAISLVQKLNLPGVVAEQSNVDVSVAHPPFNMTLTAWIDILGATMQGVSPAFAHTYREKHLAKVNPNLGLRELMGCDDRVMYLISEIACLESLKRDGMDDFTLCQHVSTLGEQITLTEMGDDAAPPRMPFNGNGTLSPRQLSRNITAAFRLAARIYLCSLVPGFNPSQASLMGLVEKLVGVLQFIPSGPGGFDRSLSWVYLIAGSVSLPGSSFRAFFEDRIAQLSVDQTGTCGSLGRVAMLLRETWMHNDALSACHTPGSAVSGAGGDDFRPHMRWRDVMQMKGWDFLLI
jgi:hypothetical protein